MNNELNQRITRIQEICGAWGLYEPGNSSAIKQALKATSEIGELADAVLKNDIDEIKDAIGDIFVCWVNFLKLDPHSIYKWGYDTEDHLDSEKIILLLRGRPPQLIHLNVIANQYYLSLLECIDAAIEVISKRKGRIINQVFVKDE
jgi:hypothetical protein